MDKCFNQEVCSILKTAEQEMFALRHPYVGTEHLLLSLLKREKIKNICSKYCLTYQNFRKELIKIVGCASKKSEVTLYTPLLRKVIDSACENAKSNNEDVNEIYLLSALLNDGDGIALQLVNNMGISPKEISAEINKPELLNKLGVNLNEHLTDEIFLRDKEIDEIMEILLRKNKNNPLLIGEAGVGKTAIIEELARRIKNKKVPKSLQKYQIYLINTSTLIAGTKYRGEFEERVNNLIKEVIKCQNVILFIDEIHNIVKTGSSDGSIDAANILKPYLARNDLKIIGATTNIEYNEYLKKDAAFARRFAPIKVNEPSLEDMEYILNKVKVNYEKYYELKINHKDLKSLIVNADLYLPNLYNPDKCIDILDTTCSKKVLSNYKNNQNDLIIKKEDLLTTIKERINISALDTNNLEKLYENLKDKYPEQNIKSIVNLFKDNTKQRYMIFNGEDNISKEKLITYIAKFLKINLISIDCKEYGDEYNLSKLVNNNYLYNKLVDSPLSIIAFNNYDEANKILYNIINTIMKKGYLTNSNNEKLYLNNAIIIIFDNKEISSIGFKQNKLLFAK